jgi:AcrR family transcriptional regulator
MSDLAFTLPPASTEAAPDAQDSAKRRQILDGARLVFLRDGYDGASMSDVAREAGVSKGTLYVYFPSKEALFEAQIRDGRARQAEHLAKLTAEGAPEETLRRYGVSLLTALASPESVAQVRAVLGVTGKFPQFGRAFYEAGVGHGVGRLAAYLEAETARGRLRVAQPQLAAVDFLEGCKAGAFARLLFGVVDALSADEIEANVARAVSTFMIVHGPR